MSKNTQRILFSVAVFAGYIILDTLGDVGKQIHIAIGGFAVGWMTWDIATFVFRDKK